MKSLLLLAFFLIYNLSYPQKPFNEYYPSNKIKILGQYDENGEKTGEWKSYYENGKLQKVGKFENGKITGEFKYYYDSGQLKHIINYENGNREGFP